MRIQPKPFLKGCMIGLVTLYGYTASPIYAGDKHKKEKQREREQCELTPTIIPTPTVTITPTLTPTPSTTPYDPSPYETPTLTPTVKPTDTPQPTQTQQQTTQTPTRSWQEEKVIYFPGEGGVIVGPQK